jgi:magnesium-transporting ATPase (P-type)
MNPRDKRKNKKQSLKNPWMHSVESILEDLEVSPEKGLSKREAAERRKRFGANRLEQRHRESAWKIFVDQFKNLID